ncbi:TetR/AcrR family transcriptional regulator [Pseudonocardia acaciae]|uniref:TetR/AcrR family transcriptional regulator n=1 Tax=Pseudonocardia acaciae TaxID=551276 RepID=UPI0007E8C273|nr:TetR/AcrR family transcriptional regulator [Pseudonocardia acaciae]
MPKQMASRRERRGLRLEAAVNAAFELAEREGVSGLTMRRLGQELNVDATALYRLFRDKDELLLALCERTIQLALDEIGEVPEDEPWRDTLHRIAESTWRIQTRLPAITALTFARTTGGPSERRMVELMLACFARSGLAPAEAVLFYRTFVDTALGLCAHSAALGSLDPEVRAKDDTAWTRIYARLPDEDYPVARGHAGELSSVDEKAIYDTAVEAILDAAQRAARRRRTQEDPAPPLQGVTDGAVGDSAPR